MITLSLPIM
jgi:hypothetical protein